MRTLFPLIISFILACWILSSHPGTSSCLTAHDAAGRAAIEENRRGVPMAPALEALEQACR